jgi:hypothetical protein
MEQKDSCACWICGGFEKSKDNISKWCCYGIGADCYYNNEKSGCYCWICGGLSYNKYNYFCCTTIPPFYNYYYSKIGNDIREKLCLYWGLGGFCKQKNKDTIGWCMGCYICPFGISRGSCIKYSCNDSKCIYCGNHTKCFCIDECCDVNKNKYETIQYICFPFGCIESEPIVQKINNDDVLLRRKINANCMCCDIDDCYSISSGAPKDGVPDPVINKENI